MTGVGHRRYRAPRSALAACLLIGSAAHAGEADVTAAEATCRDGLCTVTVSVRHDDAGWDHYADHWRVLTPGGEEFGRRVLLHPHETEQPFTRSLSGVRISPELTEVIIEAHDSVHDYGGRSLSISPQHN